MLQKYQVPKNSDFFFSSNFSNIHLEELNSPPNSFHEPNLKVAQDPTLFEDHKEDTALVSKSLKKKPGNFEISFEEDFIKEHLLAFKQCTKNFMEHSLKIKQGQQLNFFNPHIFGLEEGKAPLDILKVNLLAPKQRQQLLKDLEYEEKLMDFLTAICEEVPKHVMEEYVYLAYICWEKYLEINKPGLPQNKLLKASTEFCKEKASQIFENSSLSYLNMRVVDSQDLENIEKVQENFAEYLEFYFNTIFLVIEGYFENPFCGPEEGKRERPDNWFSEDDSFNQSHYLDDSFEMPIKRVKFD